MMDSPTVSAEASFTIPVCLRITIKVPLKDSYSETVVQLVIPHSTRTIYGPVPQDVICQFCDNSTKTVIKPKPTMFTHVMACAMRLLSMGCVPYLADSYQQRDHFCSTCESYLGTYKDKFRTNVRF